MFKKILVPTDGSDNAIQAAKYALELASCEKEEDVEIKIIHVEPIKMADVSYHTTEEEEFSVQIGDEILQQTAEIFKDASFKYSTEFRFGNPADIICEIAEKENYSLIVIGGKGKGAVKRFLMGSVSSKVVAHADIPVLIIR